MCSAFPLFFCFLCCWLDRQWAAGDKPGSTPDKQYQGTPEDQTACDGDAKRFCKTDLSDSFLVLACLQDHREKLIKPAARSWKITASKGMPPRFARLLMSRDHASTSNGG